MGFSHFESTQKGSCHRVSHVQVGVINLANSIENGINKSRPLFTNNGFTWDAKMWHQYFIEH